ncbi:unnamed protein product [marine sediment metagenome]|uniref:Uncharacterized protein n=1 Tax=marine sediment metagenome TaxID=412755 RepID=X0SL85_9ZZZZ
MTTSAVLTSDYDNRAREVHRWSVWEKKLTFIWETGDGHAEQQVALPLNGILLSIVMKVSSVTGDPDVTLTLDDNDDNEMFSITEDDGATYYYWWWFDVLQGTMDVGVNPSADPGGAAQTLTVTVWLRGI